VSCHQYLAKGTTRLSGSSLVSFQLCNCTKNTVRFKAVLDFIDKNDGPLRNR